jgi:hypothetical protein
MGAHLVPPPIISTSRPCLLLLSLKVVAIAKMINSVHCLEIKWIEASVWRSLRKINTFCYFYVTNSYNFW